MMMKMNSMGAVRNSLRVVAILICVAVIPLPFFAGADAADVESYADATVSSEADPQSEREFDPEESVSSEKQDHSENGSEFIPHSPVRPESDGTADLGESLPELDQGSPAEDHASMPDTGESSLDEAVPDRGRQQTTGLAANERVVRTFLELKDALSNDNGITTVYFGADITVDRAAGVQIHNSKTNVEVVGVNPLDQTRTEPYTLTDYATPTFTDTIYISTSGVKSLLVRDLKIVGKNFYGSFSALDSGATDGLIITYERVDYNGPQIGYNRGGLLRFVDCTVRIHGGNGGSRSEEFAEAKRLQFVGRNTIDTTTSVVSTFWHPSGGSFEIMDGAELVLTAGNMGTTFGLFYADGIRNNVDIRIGQRAVFDAAISGTVALPAQVTLSGLTVREDGAFRLKTTKTASVSALVMGGNVVVEQNAAFVINGYGGAGYAVLEQRAGGIAVNDGATFKISGSYGRLLDLHGSSLTCNDPASVLLYNPSSRDIRATTTAGRLYVNAEQVNYWTAAGSGGFDDPPLYRWKKADGSNFWIDGTIATGASGNISAISSNYAVGDWPGTAPSSTTFNMPAARVIAFGRLELAVNTPTEASNNITGVTAPGAAVRASFTQNGTDYTLPDVVADANGSFVIPVEIPLAESTLFTVQSNFQFLTATATVLVERVGKLAFIVPDQLHFFTGRLASDTQMVRRLENNWSILVSDTRGSGSNWRVYARAFQPPTHTTRPDSILRNALGFADDTGNFTPLDTVDALLIHKRATVSNNDVTAIKWAADRGILCRVLPGTAFTGSYTAAIEWTLVDAP